MEAIRSELKHNFLKQIIFRMDYEGIMEADVEKCVIQLRNIFFDANLKRMENRTENQMDVQLKMDLNISDEDRISIASTNQSLVYRFISENNEVIELSKTFFTLTVDIENAYESFDKYIELLTKTIDIIKNSSPYFRMIRIGLRKINICFVKHLDCVEQYFTKAAFNIQNIIDQFNDYSCRASNMVTVLSRDGFEINYIRNLQEGIFQQEDGDQERIYQVVLDIDVFMDNSKNIMNVLSSKEKTYKVLVDQNRLEFITFIKSLNEKFIEELKADEFVSNEIEGVI